MGILKKLKKVFFLTDKDRMKRGEWVRVSHKKVPRWAKKRLRNAIDGCLGKMPTNKYLNSNFTANVKGEKYKYMLKNISHNTCPPSDHEEWYKRRK